VERAREAHNEAVVAREAQMRLQLCCRSPLVANARGRTIVLVGQADSHEELEAVVRELHSSPGVSCVSNCASVSRR